MSLGSWLKSLFSKHKITFNGQTVAAALAVAKQNVDSFAAVEPAIKDKLPQLDQAFDGAIAGLQNWKSGDSKAEIEASLTAAEGVLNSIEGISQHTKLIIDGVIAIVQTDLALLT